MVYYNFKNPDPQTIDAIADYAVDSLGLHEDDCLEGTRQWSHENASSPAYGFMYIAYH